MKIILNESQYRRLLNEDTLGIDEFIGKIISKHPELEEHSDYLKTTIMASGVQAISFEELKAGVGGISLHDKVIINSYNLKYHISDLFYIIFHELGHQYQFKKYGHEKMYGVFKNDAHILRSIDWLRETEKVADQYGMRKTRELYNRGILSSEPTRKEGSYDKFTDHMFYEYVIKLKHLIDDVANTDPMRASELLYNWVINNKEVKLTPLLKTL